MAKKKKTNSSQSTKKIGLNLSINNSVVQEDYLSSHVKIEKTNELNFTRSKASKQFKVKTDITQLEKLKSKIRELENKIGEINKDQKEKEIIESIKDYRSQINPPEKGFY